MPISRGARPFLASAPVHLAVWGFCSAAGLLSVDGRTWLFLVGFVGFSVTGFAWHLFPTMARRPLVGLPNGPALWVAAESSVLFGVLGAWPVPEGSAGPGFAVGSRLIWLACTAVFVTALLRSRWSSSKGQEPPRRPADAAATVLFATAWPFGGLAAVLWLASAVARGPGFGYWLAGVHFFLLGQVVLLIVSVSLRLLPRFVGADGPRWLPDALAVCALGGAVTLPAMMLALPPRSAPALVLPGLLEAGAAVLFVAQLLWIGRRASTPRTAHWAYLASGLCLWAGGALGLLMVGASRFDLVGVHAWVNLVGFVTLMILGMWFSMIAPFQFISHRWTRRALGTGVALALASVGLTAVAGLAPAGSATVPSWAAGSAVAALGALWSAGTLPVLYPRSVRPSVG